jgi:alkanesulfonate monooxygenase SsuD/methylene tetrahydromethanopterin reductase-like flavin-dependent oxidoreductase (luciferase family)
VIGSPDTVAERLLEIEQETGLSHVRTWFKFGDVTIEDAERSLALFSESVLPRLHPERIEGVGEPVTAHAEV